MRVEEGERSSAAHRLNDDRAHGGEHEEANHINTSCLPSPLSSPFHLLSKHTPPTTASHPFLDLFALSEHTDGFYS